MASKEKFRCARCGSELTSINFYRHHDGVYDDLCKQCLCAHVNNFDPSTFEWILKKLDYPYVPQEWEKTLKQAIDKHGINKLTGISVMGRYISRMKLNAWKDYTYKDSEELQKRYTEAINLDDATKEELQAKLEAGEITQAEYDTYAGPLVAKDNTISMLGVEEYIASQPSPAIIEPVPLPVPRSSPFSSLVPQDAELPPPEEPLFDVQLSKEEQTELRIKWGNYKVDEYLQLESFYNDMLESFEIQDADSLAALKLICKTQLKMNQAIDMEDFDSYQKLSKVYNDMRKSAKFTAAQNKEESLNAFDSVGQLVAFCEKEDGAIPRFDFTVDPDVVDKTLADNKQYLYDLVTQDTALSKQIEEVIAKMNKLQLSDNEEITDEDFMEYFQEEENQINADLEGDEEYDEFAGGASPTTDLDQSP